MRCTKIYKKYRKYKSGKGNVDKKYLFIRLYTFIRFK